MPIVARLVDDLESGGVDADEVAVQVQLVGAVVPPDRGCDHGQAHASFGSEGIIACCALQFPSLRKPTWFDDTPRSMKPHRQLHARRRVQERADVMCLGAERDGVHDLLPETQRRVRCKGGQRDRDLPKG